MNRKGVILLILVLAVINYIWLAIDNFPLWFDHGQYYQKSILLFFASQQGPLDFVREVLGIGAPYWCHIHRIIIPLFSLPFYYILGLSADAAVLSGTIFLAAALLSTYAIATRLFDKRTGFLAAFILATSPGLFIYSRRYSPEFATIGIVALMLYFLLRTENFRNRLFSILFGAWGLFITRFFVVAEKLRWRFGRLFAGPKSGIFTTQYPQINLSAGLLWPTPWPGR